MLPSVTGTPIGVTANRTDLISVLVSWTAPSSAPDGYEVFYQVAGGSRLSGGTVNSSYTSLLLDHLNPALNYSIIVVAHGEMLPSAHSNTAHVPAG